MSQSNLAQSLPSEPLYRTRAVHKFGGSSLATAECIERVAGIVQANCQAGDCIVVSANGDTTDRLLAIYHQYVSGGLEACAMLEELRKKHTALITTLLLPSNANRILTQFAAEFLLLQQWLSSPERDQNLNNALALGEIWSARLLAAVLHQRDIPSDDIDARTFLKLEAADPQAIAYEASWQQLTPLLKLHQV